MGALRCDVVALWRCGVVALCAKLRKPPGCSTTSVGVLDVPQRDARGQLVLDESALRRSQHSRLRHDEVVAARPKGDLRQAVVDGAAEGVGVAFVRQSAGHVALAPQDAGGVPRPRPRLWS